MEFVQVDSGTAEIITFSLTASDDIDTDTTTTANLRFSAVAYPTANAALINNTYSHDELISTLVIVPKPKLQLFFSGEITTDNDASYTTDSVTLEFTTPGYESVDSLSASVTLHSGAFSLINTLAQEILDGSVDYVNAHEIIASIDILSKYWDVIYSYPSAGSGGQSYFYKDRLLEIEIKITQLYDYLQANY